MHVPRYALLAAPRVLLIAGSLVLAAVAFGAPMKFDIPAQSAPGALQSFIKQSGAEVLFSFDELKDVKTNAVAGSLEPGVALQALLRNTGYAVKTREAGRFVVATAKTAKTTSSPGSASPGKESAPNDPNGKGAARKTASDRPRVNKTPSTHDDSSDDRAVQLSPFEVTAEEDHGYTATSTLAGTRLRSDLKDIAASISVLTKDFMDDVNATDMTSLLVYTLGTEVGGFGGNFSDLSNIEANGVFDDSLGQPTPGIRIRGLFQADNTRGYFLSDLPQDTYNTERVEVSRGANSILFGLGSPSGIVNRSTIRADTRKRATELSASVGSYGSYRGTLDHNEALLRDKLALRLATVFDNTRYRTEFAYIKRRAATLAATYRPFKNTVFRANSEVGRSNSNKPEIRPPYDRFSEWWAMGKPVWNPALSQGRLLGTPSAPYTATSLINAAGSRANSNILTNQLGWNASVPGIFYLDPNSSVAGGLSIGGGQVVDGIKGFATNSVASGAGGTGPGSQSGGMVGLGPYHLIYQTYYAPTDPLRTLVGKERQISDPSFFDFYHEMIGGPTKYEYSWWEAHNVTIEQTFFDRRAGVEVTFDRQRLDTGFTSPVNYTINIDINETLPNGAPNPNFLRPWNGYPGFKRVESRDRDAIRATAYYDLDLRRMKGPRWLGPVLGRHQFNVNYTGQESTYQQYAGFMWANDLDWRAAEKLALPGNVNTAGRLASTVHYYGPSVGVNSTSPHDLHAQGLRAGQDPSGMPSMNILYNEPVSAATLPPNAWAARTFGFVSNGEHNVDHTRGNNGKYAYRSQQEVESVAVALQSHWLAGNLVGTLGWRRDEVRSFLAPSPRINEFGSADVNDPNFQPQLQRAVAGNSTSYGFVGHLPRRLSRYLPLESQVSAFYNKAENFRIASQRFTITGVPLPSETGETEEYGIRLSTLNGRLELRVARFRTIAANASVTGINGAINQLQNLIENVVDQNFGGRNVGNPAGIADFEAWLESPTGQVISKAFNYSFTPNSNSDGLHPLNIFGRYEDATDGSHPLIEAVSALESTGTEFEVTFNPTKRWRIHANAASATAVRTNIGPEMYEVLFSSASSVLNLVSTSSGPTSVGSLLGGANLSANTLQSFFNSNVLNLGAIRAFAQQGAKSDELRKWRFNIVTNYTFDSEMFGGRLKGFSIGGSVRWADRPLLGYAGTLSAIAGQSVPVADITRPYFGERDYNFDANIGYRRKLAHNINWSVRLFVKNIGVGNELIPLFVYPDGTPYQYRIREAQKWNLVNTFSF